MAEPIQPLRPTYSFTVSTGAIPVPPMEQMIECPECLAVLRSNNQWNHQQWHARLSEIMHQLVGGDVDEYMGQRLPGWPTASMVGR